MKSKVISFVIAFCMLLGVAFAANEVTINESSVNFYAYGEGQTTNQVVTLMSNISTPITVTLNGGLFFNSDNTIAINFTSQDFSLTPYQNQTVTLQVDSNGLDSAESGKYIGNINIYNKTGGNLISSVPATIWVPGLRLTKLTSSDNSVTRGEEVNVTLSLKNLGKVGYLDDLNLEDMKIVDRHNNVLQNEDGDDLEVTDESLDRLKNGDTDTITEQFTLPFELDGSSLTIYARVKGCNEEYSSECFTAEINKSITIDIPDDSVAITRAAFSPSILDCDSDNRTKLSFEVKNLGQHYQYLTYILTNPNTLSEQVLNSGNEEKLDNKFDSTDGYTLTHEEYIDLSNLRTGQNPFTLTVDYGTKTPATTTVMLTKNACAATVQPVTPTQPTEPVVVVQPTQQPTTPVVIPTSNQGTVTLKDVSGFSLGNDWTIPAVIGGIGLIFGVIIALLFARR